jgi:hypothetical protein
MQIEEELYRICQRRLTLFVAKIVAYLRYKDSLKHMQECQRRLSCTSGALVTTRLDNHRILANISQRGLEIDIHSLRGESGRAFRDTPFYKAASPYITKFYQTYDVERLGDFELEDPPIVASLHATPNDDMIAIRSLIQI